MAEEKVSAAEQRKRDQLVQEARDKAMQPKLDEAYEKSRTTPMAKGGMTASARADGIAQRGKTKGTMIAMCGGGKAKK